ncbi:hypothetical protein HU200_054221 [Digitaria exilis]|uniref:F-box domain-containing protein n=1 Tax=Digitaria exilis TaxID=1010633 RepID=A0A835E2M9_9POAL|nr:hypothetical protein HU200_054221 [Digitaria exilis]
MSMAASLPDDVLVEILARLPARSIGRVRAVCRAWRAVTTHPSFDRALAGRPHAVAKVTTNLYLSGLNFDLFHGR